MLATQILADWLTDTTGLPLRFKFRPGPEQLEFDVANNSATITRVPGGSGLGAQGTEDDHMFLLLIRSGRENIARLEEAMDVLDRRLLAVGSEMIWGTYVQFVDRIGDILPDYDAPERATFGATYQIREGRE